MIELITQNIDTLLAFITGGGLTSIFAFGANRRKVNAEAREKEIDNLNSLTNFFEKRIQERDLKVDALYIELRKEQEAKLDLIEKLNKQELRCEILEIKKCEKRGCADRLPPSDY